MSISRKQLVTLAAVVAGLASRAYAGPITVPAGLAPGSQYRLVFATTDAYLAFSTDIATYNTDVSTDAALPGPGATPAPLGGLDTTWSAIASTPSVNAIDNIGEDAGIPIYNTAGLLVANDATTAAGGLFSGSLLSGISYDEDGDSETGHFAWTGTQTNGDAVTGLALGEDGDEAIFGLIGSSDAAWVNDVEGGGEAFLYAISGTLTVPVSTPEPSTTGLATLGSLILLFATRKHRLTDDTRQEKMEHPG